MSEKVFKIYTLSGAKQSGKNTVADRLSNFHGFAQIAFADYLKELCLGILSKIDCEVSKKHFEDGQLKESFIYDIYGKQMLFNNRGKKEIPMTYRQFLQIVGTECFRDLVHDEMWILPVKKFIRETYTSNKFNGVAITDARFPNEVENLKVFMQQFYPTNRYEFMSINVVRPDLPKTDLHASETSMRGFEFDLGINNNGSLQELFEKVDKVVTGQWREDKLKEQVKQTYLNSWIHKYNHPKKCHGCNGDGSKDLNGVMYACAVCHGKGILS